MGNILSEPGVNRINHLSKGWPDPTTYTTQMTFRTYLDNIVKPQSIWDVTKYMNVWITDKSDLLMSGGVSTVPPLSTLPGIPNTATDKTDGIWCYTKSIGSYALYPSGDYFSSNIDGRTLTHTNTVDTDMASYGYSAVVFARVFWHLKFDTKFHS